jgi:hypothetical protein
MNHFQELKTIIREKRVAELSSSSAAAAAAEITSSTTSNTGSYK